MYFSDTAYRVTVDPLHISALDKDFPLTWQSPACWLNAQSTDPAGVLFDQYCKSQWEFFFSLFVSFFSPCHCAVTILRLKMMNQSPITCSSGVISVLAGLMKGPASPMSCHSSISHEADSGRISSSVLHTHIEGHSFYQHTWKHTCIHPWAFFSHMNFKWLIMHEDKCTWAGSLSRTLCGGYSWKTGRSDMLCILR